MPKKKSNISLPLITSSYTSQTVQSSYNTNGKITTNQQHIEVKQDQDGKIQGEYVKLENGKVIKKIKINKRNMPQVLTNASIKQ